MTFFSTVINGFLGYQGAPLKLLLWNVDVMVLGTVKGCSNNNNSLVLVAMKIIIEQNNVFIDDKL